MKLAGGAQQLAHAVDAASARCAPAPSVSLLTWNTLAPCYFRDGRQKEANFPHLYLARHSRICTAIAEADADVVCLQEHWFEGQLARLYEERLGWTYEILTLQRSDHNWEGRSQDGIAILLRRGSLELLARHDVIFEDYGLPQDRVALLAEIRDVRSAQNGGDSASFVVLCTHLTYPHHHFDQHSRLNQTRVCLEAMRSKVLHARGWPWLMCGDFNGPVNDDVGQLLSSSDFQSVWCSVHSRSCVTTHVDHRGQQYASDHVWLRGKQLVPSGAELLPRGVPDSAALLRPAIGRSAAAGPEARSVVDEEWSNLSDHRPLLVTLAWDPEDAAGKL